MKAPVPSWFMEKKTSSYFKLLYVDLAADLHQNWQKHPLLPEETNLKAGFCLEYRVIHFSLTN